MGSSPFRRIFLPSLVSSGLAFAVITLPLSMANSIPSWALPSQARRGLTTPLDDAAKPIIRYIGLAIIGSVGTGMLTADMLRRMYQRREVLTETATFDSSSSADAVSKVAVVDNSESASLAVTAEPTTPFSPQTLLGTKLAARHAVVNVQASHYKGSVDSLELTPVPLEELMRLDTEGPAVDVPLLSFLTEVEPVHLNTGDGVLFGVRYHNQYYCLWRSVDNQERAMGWARRLIRQYRDIIVTQHEQGHYSLWYSPPEQTSPVDISVSLSANTSRR